MKFFLAVILLVASANALDISKLKRVEVKPQPIHPKLAAARWKKVGTSNYNKASASIPPVPQDSRIVGGYYAQPGQFPWQAFLIMDQSYVCGGSLISSDFVLTAGHCGFQHNQIVVNLGKTNLQEQEPGEVITYSTQIIVHQGFDPNYLHNDICLVRLGQSVQPNGYIDIIRLAQGSINLDGQMATISGFGKYTDNSGISQQLRYVTLPVVPIEQCASAFPGVDESQICTDTSGGHSACNGDSGGPLVMQLNDGIYEVGLVSFGSTQGCTLGIPAVFTRITYFRDWIRQNSGV